MLSIRPRLTSFAGQSFICVSCLEGVVAPPAGRRQRRGCSGTAAPADSTKHDQANVRRRRSGLSSLLRSRPGHLRDGEPQTSWLPDRPARTRFAPSPTGYLHMGGLRTALYNYLLAKATKGQFILRIEDTDRTRTVPDAQERLMNDLKWAQIQWDEGPDIGGAYGPYVQSERVETYTSHAAELINAGHAYRCFCKPEDLEEQRKQSLAQGHGTGYPGNCRNLDLEKSARRAAAGEEHCIRFKLGEQPVPVVDRVFGYYQKKNEEGGDLIIVKRDGYPTYHFANVVDDHLMGVTHVIRGEEWLISTPKHVAMYNAFGWQPPEFAHVGLLVNEKGRKLSKRDFDADLAKLRESTQPQPLLAWLFQLGSFVPAGMSLNTMDDLVNAFSYKFTKGHIKINPPKLAAIQQTYQQHLRSSVADGSSA